MARKHPKNNSTKCLLHYVALFAVNVPSEHKLISISGDYMWWTPEEPGFVYHVVTAISEWTVFFLILLYILSYTKEFAELQFEEIKFRIKNVL